MRMMKTEKGPNGGLGLHVRCCVCGQLYPSGTTWVDLDGEPFNSYYCESCVLVARDERECIRRVKLGKLFLGEPTRYDNAFPWIMAGVLLSLVGIFVIARVLLSG